MRKLIVGVLVLVLVAASIYVAAGRAAGPAIRIASPEKFVGVATPLEVVVKAPGGKLSSLAIDFEQGGTRTSLYRWALYATAQAPADCRSSDGPDGLHLVCVVGRQSVPAIKSGAGKIIVSALRPVLYGLRQATTETTHDVQVRLEPPRVSVVSTHHYINLGGSEMAVYRVSPPDVQSGVRVGDLEYPGYPASGLTVDGVTIADPAIRVAFFALLYDQDVNASMQLFARDEAGNTAKAEFDHRTFPKKFKASRIDLDDKFLDRVVPAILQGTTEVKPEGATIDKFQAINGDLRKKNAATIASFAAKTSPEMFWRGVVFHPFTNSAVEAAFADYRTYYYKGREVDRQVHLGFDLASYAGTKIVAANRGMVLFAAELGIYGSCVIIDHGMGVQSLYAHLSSIGVQPGAMLEKDQEIGRSGMTGLAGGDHLHFTMLVHGRAVNPIEWWDPHWIQDRVVRKLQEAR